MVGLTFRIALRNDGEEKKQKKSRAYSTRLLSLREKNE